MANGTAIQTVPDKVKGCMDLFEKMRPQIADVLPKHITPERMIRLLRAMMHKRQDLAKCSRETLIGAVIECSILGLEPETPLGLAWILPYKDKAQLIIGWKGYVQLALRSKSCVVFPPQIVYENDRFQCHRGTRNEIIHESVPNGERGKAIGVYAMAQIIGIDKPVWVYLDRERVMWHKSFSPAASSKYSPWSDPKLELEMWEKSAIRELVSFLPLVTDSPMARAVSMEQASEVAGFPQYPTIEADSLEPEIEDVKARIQEANAKANPQSAESHDEAGVVAMPLGPPPNYKQMDVITRRELWHRLMEASVHVRNDFLRVHKLPDFDPLDPEIPGGVKNSQTLSDMLLWVVQEKIKEEQLPAKRVGEPFDELTGGSAELTEARVVTSSRGPGRPRKEETLLPVDNAPPGAFD